MDDPNGILETVASLEGADLPHIHAPTTVGDVVRQILARHPLLPHASVEDARRMVAIVAGLDGAHHVHYGIGDRDGGNLGGTGSWASVGKGGAAMLSISGTLPLVYPQSDPPEDPTLLDRAAEELRRRVGEISGDPSWVRLLHADKAAFGGEDRITFATPATPGGTDTFHVHLSHIAPPFTAGIERNLDEAAATIVAQHVHADEIRARIDRIRERVERRFHALGMDVGETVLLGVETADGDVASVKAATEVTILGDAFERKTAFLQMSAPESLAKGEFDAFRVHSRDTARRLRTLAGRDPVDACTMCPVAARDYASMDAAAARAKAAEVRRMMDGRHQVPRDEKQGPDFHDGRLADTVFLAQGVTFRNRTLMAKGMQPPESVMMNLPGRPLTDVVDDARLAGLVVDKARIDSKGRLTVTVHGVPGVPLRPVLEAMEAG